MEDLEGPYILNGLWSLFFPQTHAPAWFLPLAGSWLVILVMLIMGVMATRRVSLVPGPWQNVVEIAWDGMRSFTRQLGGAEAERFLPFFTTLFLFILCSNWIGLIPGFASPTTNININAGLAIVVALMSIGLAVRSKGLFGFFKHLCGPPYWLAPLFIIIRTMELFTRPLSLTMRLFGNMLAKEIILGVLVYLITLFLFSSGWIFKALLLVPLALRPAIILLGVLVGFIQALVFTGLAMTYIGEALEQTH